MSESRTKGGRPGSRAFRPLLDGRLEDRVLMSSQSARIQEGSRLFQRYLLKHPARAERLSAQTNRRNCKACTPVSIGQCGRRAGVAATETAQGAVKT